MAATGWSVDWPGWGQAPSSEEWLSLPSFSETGPMGVAHDVTIYSGDQVEGQDPAVTDANVALGRINPTGTLAGSLAIQSHLAATALEAVGDRLGLSGEEAALGVITVVEEIMAGAIRSVSIEQGADPRSGYLVAFGGAGGLHATALARRLDMAGVIIPPFSGVFSALGLLLSPPRADAARSNLLESGEMLDSEVDAVIAMAEGRLVAGGADVAATSSFADVRYYGQSHETTVPYAPGDGWDEMLGRFHAMHQERNGFARVGDAVQVVTVRAESVGRPLLTWADLPEVVPSGKPERPPRPVLTADGEVMARVVDRTTLGEGTEIVGPAIVEETEATTYIAPGERAVVHSSGAMEVQW